MIKGPRVWRPWIVSAVNQVAHGIRQFFSDTDRVFRLK